MSTIRRRTTARKTDKQTHSRVEQPVWKKCIESLNLRGVTYGDDSSPSYCRVPLSRGKLVDINLTIYFYDLPEWDLDVVRWDDASRKEARYYSHFPFYIIKAAHEEYVNALDKQARDLRRGEGIYISSAALDKAADILMKIAAFPGIRLHRCRRPNKRKQIADLQKQIQIKEAELSSLRQALEELQHSNKEHSNDK